MELHHPDRLRSKIADILHIDQSSVVDDPDPVARSLHLRQDVGRQEDRPAASRRLQHEVVEFPLDDGVETLRGFVQDQQVRLMHQSLDQSELLDVPVGERGDPRFEVACEAIRQTVEGRRAESAERGEELEISAARHPPIGAEVTGQVADAAMDLEDVTVGIQSEQGGVPHRRAKEIQHRSDRRGLTSTVGTEESEDLAGLDLKGHLLDPTAHAVPLGEPIENDRGAGSHRATPAGLRYTNQ